jgi:hypothetical protein
MEAFFLSIRRQSSRTLFLFFFFILLAHCKQNPERDVHPSFYYWKTNFFLTEKEKTVLQKLSIKSLYAKFFDVEWNKAANAPRPIATINFKQTSPSNTIITPVVFITNETIAKSSAKQIIELASNVIKLLTSIVANNHLSISNEVQIDCDWTASTRGKYFQLLKGIKTHPFLKNKLLSATIRLHQLKFISVNGIPPVDKGLLMCYNMGNLKHPEVKNSIIELNELKKYTNNLNTYPLPLDIALPVFSWYVWFHGIEYRGLIHNFPDEEKQQKILFEKDTTINGYNFKKDDWLRYENSNAKEVIEAGKHLGKKLGSKTVNVILYHLDENNFDNYKEYELEDMFNSLK